MQLNYFAYCNSTGYSEAAQSYLLSLLKVKPDINIKMHFINHKIGDGVSKNRKQLFTALHKKELKEPSTNLYHCIPPIYQKTGKKNIGFCVFETINPPPDWISKMNEMDAIITASSFNKNIFENNGVKIPIHVVPHCFDSNLFNENVPNNGRFDKTTFISIGTWKKRKNWESLIKAWYEAFEYRHNVCLLIKTDKPDELKATVHHIKTNFEWRSKLTAPIYCEENPICDFEEIPSILRKGDIYISCSLGEGFSLPILQAMAMKIPVITTRFGGVLEYAKPEFCTYLEPDKYQSVLTMDSVPQFKNCIWPHIPIKEIATKMIYILQNTKEREEKCQKAYDYVHKNLNYEKIGKKLLGVLEL